MINDAATDLIWLAAVIEHQSFSAAAEKLGVSKSVISKYISRLEKQLGVQLLKRTTRSLSLTEMGEMIYQRTTNIIEELNQIKKLADSHQDVPQGKLRINAPFSFGQRHLVPAVAAFMKKYPQIRVELILGSYLADLISDGIDLAIYLKKPRQQNLIIRQISQHRSHVCATEKYLKKFGTPKKPEDLLQHNCLTYKSLDYQKSWIFQHKHSERFELDVQGNFSANSSQALLNAALNDVGIVKLSSHIVGKELEKGKLISVLDSYCEKNIGIYIARMHTNYLPKKIRLFIDFLLDYFNQ